MKHEQKKVCLLLNLGGFEARMGENLELAKNYGETVYSLTGEGLVKVEVGTYLVPASVLDLTPAELLIWGSLINEQLQEEGFEASDAVILAAGKNYRGLLPLGTTIAQGIKLGA
ncbi:hypothetical protein L1N85_24575 [Paenibacillus alkaliterrae]|uniref:hypothetical protein n=1 Tax=Paenibacillus alkaliterrae TaxID=320909 RepID=UPI001F2B6E7C|nr:hypothetical protein [Paenibacillus alkaliterrae]MCF2941517.1 hypothetical protein [Paenibacillus alkaliterrae]